MFGSHDAILGQMVNPVPPVGTPMQDASHFPQDKNSTPTDDKLIDTISKLSNTTQEDTQPSNNPSNTTTENDIFTMEENSSAITAESENTTITTTNTTDTQQDIPHVSAPTQLNETQNFAVQSNSQVDLTSQTENTEEFEPSDGFIVDLPPAVNPNLFDGIPEDQVEQWYKDLAEDAKAARTVVLTLDKNNNAPQSNYPITPGYEEYFNQTTKNQYAQPHTTSSTIDNNTQPVGELTMQRPTHSTTNTQQESLSPPTFSSLESLVANTSNSSNSGEIEKPNPIIDPYTQYLNNKIGPATENPTLPTAPPNTVAPPVTSDVAQIVEQQQKIIKRVETLEDDLKKAKNNEANLQEELRRREQEEAERLRAEHDAKLAALGKTPKPRGMPNKPTDKLVSVPNTPITANLTKEDESERSKKTKTAPDNITVATTPPTPVTQHTAININGDDTKNDGEKQALIPKKKSKSCSESASDFYAKNPKYVCWTAVIGGACLLGGIVAVIVEFLPHNSTPNNQTTVYPIPIDPVITGNADYSFDPSSSGATLCIRVGLGDLPLVFQQVQFVTPTIHKLAPWNVDYALPLYPSGSTFQCDINPSGLDYTCTIILPEGNYTVPNGKEACATFDFSTGLGPANTPLIPSYVIVVQVDGTTIQLSINGLTNNTSPGYRLYDTLNITNYYNRHPGFFADDLPPMGVITGVISQGFFIIDPETGVISPQPNPGPNINGQELSRVIQYKEQNINFAEHVVAFGGEDFASGFNTLASNQTATNTFANSVKGIAYQTRANRVYIDWQYDNTTTPNFPALVNLATTLRNTLPSEVGMILWMPGDQSIQPPQDVLTQLQQLGIEFAIFGSTYNTNSPNAEFGSPLYSRPNSTNTNSVNNSINAYASAGIPHHQMGLTIDSQGYASNVQSMGVSHGYEQPSNGLIQDQCWFYKIGKISYRCIVLNQCDCGPDFDFKVVPTSQNPYGNTTAQQPWAYNDNQLIVATYDDQGSVVAKTQFVKAQNMSFIIINDAAADALYNTSYSLAEAVQIGFTSNQTVNGTHAAYQTNSVPYASAEAFKNVDNIALINDNAAFVQRVHESRLVAWNDLFGKTMPPALYNKYLAEAAKGMGIAFLLAIASGTYEPALKESLSKNGWTDSQLNALSKLIRFCLLIMILAGETLYTKGALGSQDMFNLTLLPSIELAVNCVYSLFLFSPKEGEQADIASFGTMFAAKTLFAAAEPISALITGGLAMATGWAGAQVARAEWYKHGVAAAQYAVTSVAQSVGNSLSRIWKRNTPAPTQANSTALVVRANPVNTAGNDATINGLPTHNETTPTNHYQNRLTK